jgi:hypothetical protein
MVYPIGFVSAAWKAKNMLNEPLPSDDGVEPLDDWTPWKGLRRAAVHGAIASVLAAALLGVIARYAPLVLLNVWIRLATGFFVTWTLFAVIHRAAGMVVYPCTAMAAAYALLVLFSQNAVLALHGVPGKDGVVAGWIWLDPGALIAVNCLGLIGVGIGIALCHEGGAVWRSVVEILTSRIMG